LTSLQSSIATTLKSKKDATLATTSKTTLAPIRAPPATKARRTLKGHFGKITALHWAGDSTAVVSASQDGNLLLWNAVTANKLQSISLRSSYVMSVGMEQSQGKLVACGGLDNLCTVYKWNASSSSGSASSPVTTAPQEMASHDGFVSCCRFISPQNILTASGDSTCIRWDVTSGRVVDRFQEHKADAMFLALRPQDPSTFVSCSVDRTIKVWDVRSPKTSQQTFTGHNGDINAVDFMPSDNNVVASCSEDGTVRVWDLRSYQEVATLGNYTSPNGTTTNNSGVGAGGGGPSGAGGGGAAGSIPLNRPNDFDDSSSEGFTSISFSRSGRLLFCGHSDGNVVAFDTLSSTSSPSFVLQQAHDGHVSCVGVSPDGSALCTGSWDFQLKIWA
jgi:guanine nucleotide-binding protein G(I)/G(S)/G(T) subunit beta-1